MDVYDSSVWIFGLTRTCDEAERAVDQVLGGDREVSVSAYIFEEGVNALAYSGMSEENLGRIQTDFATIVHGRTNIQHPTQEAVARIDLDEYREAPRTQLLALTLKIQPKDVPVYEHAVMIGGRTSLLTCDRQFSTLEPYRHGVPDVEMVYIDCSGGR